MGNLIPCHLYFMWGVSCNRLLSFFLCSQAPSKENLSTLCRPFCDLAHFSNTFNLLKLPFFTFICTSFDPVGIMCYLNRECQNFIMNSISSSS